MRTYLFWSVVNDEHLNVTNTSSYSGRQHTLRIRARPSQFTLWQQGAKIQEAFPNLTPDEREFIISGITKEEWNELFGE